MCIVHQMSIGLRVDPRIQWKANGLMYIVWVILQSDRNRNISHLIPRLCAVSLAPLVSCTRTDMVHTTVPAYDYSHKEETLRNIALHKRIRVSQLTLLGMEFEKNPSISFPCHFRNVLSKL